MTDLDAYFEARFANVVRDRDDMHPYQGTAVQFLKKTPFSIAMVDMGLGKSITSLTLIADLLMELNEEDKVLVIAPLRVATDTWPTEIGLWQHTAWMNWTLLRADEDDPRLAVARREGKAWARSEGLSPRECEAQATRAETAERRRIMEDLARSPASIHIVNREEVDWLIHFWKEKWPYRTVIIDESSSFKDHNSLRFQALAKTRRTPGLITRMHLLTATPAAETYEHLFAQIYLLDLGERLGKNITTYRKAYFSYNRWSMKWELGTGNEERILAKIADISLVMKRKDYLPAAEPTVIQHKVKLAQSQLDLIKKLERDFLITLPDGTELEAKTAAILSSMLLQMASGSVYETLLVEDWETDDLLKVKKVHYLHEHKIDTLREIAEEAAAEGEPLLVAYYFQSSLARLQKAFPKATTMDKAGKCIKPWNAGKIPMLFIHPQSAGHGLNLQYGGSTLIFFDLIYSLEYYLQTIGRIDRQGQTKPVVVQLLVAEGTRDELVAECLLKKEDAQNKFFSILKRLIRKLKGQPDGPP